MEDISVREAEAPWACGFESRREHSRMGLSINGRSPVRHAGDEGSIPSDSTTYLPLDASGEASRLSTGRDGFNSRQGRSARCPRRTMVVRSPLKRDEEGSIPPGDTSIRS